MPTTMLMVLGILLYEFKFAWWWYVIAVIVAGIDASEKR